MREEFDPKNKDNNLVTLADFSIVVMQAIHSLGEKAYGVNIVGRVSDVLERDVTISELYQTLGLLDGQGLIGWQDGQVETSFGEAKTVKIFHVTKDGFDAMAKAQNARQDNGALDYGVWVPS